MTVSNRRTRLAVTIVVLTGMTLSGFVVADRRRMPTRAKNIIFMVPDGMGLSNVTAARIFKNGPDGAPLSFETMPQIGYQRTHSANSTVTDSAAAASAWACGEKYNNGEISCHDNDFDGVCDEGWTCVTPLEMAEKLGKSTGLVVTSDITHATPAVWGAHVHNRKCEYTIAEQLIQDSEVDVLLGGGIANDRSSCLLPHTDNTDIDLLIADAQNTYGYSYATDRSELESAVMGGVRKLLGLFKTGGKTPELFRVDGSAYPAGEPTLPEMTEAALEILERNHRGFFLMVEGSQIDWASHANDLPYQVGETLAFEETVRVVLDWVNACPMRRAQTLVIVVPDHDTAGFAINGPYGVLSEAGQIVEDGWTSGGHTAQDVLIWSQGPCSSRLGAALDNTDLFDVMASCMR